MIKNFPTYTCKLGRLTKVYFVYTTVGRNFNETKEYRLIIKMTELLLKNGWEEVIVESNDDNYIIKLAEKYGIPFPDSNGNLVQTLKSKEKGEGIRNSFSFNYGFDSFPFHTDTAFYQHPARYFLLTSIFTSETCTNIIDFKQIIDALNQDEINTIKKSIFLIKTTEEQRFTSFFFNQNKEIGFRFDPNIMLPYNSHAKKAMEIINDKIANSKPIKIKWSTKNILIVDNWRCLHSRDNIVELNRTLKRIYIK